jgi:hypothetical protein
MTILRLESGLTIEQLRTALLAEQGGGAPAGPAPFAFAGGIVALDRGSKGWIDLNLPAGNYALICFVPDVNSGQPHFALGMLKGLTVR